MEAIVGAILGYAAGYISGLIPNSSMLFPLLGVGMPPVMGLTFLIVQNSVGGVGRSVTELLDKGNTVGNPYLMGIKTLKKRLELIKEVVDVYFLIRVGLLISFSIGGIILLQQPLKTGFDLWIVSLAFTLFSWGVLLRHNPIKAIPCIALSYYLGTISPNILLLFIAVFQIGGTIYLPFKKEAKKVEKRDCIDLSWSMTLGFISSILIGSPGSVLLGGFLDSKTLDDRSVAMNNAASSASSGASSLLLFLIGYGQRDALSSQIPDLDISPTGIFSIFILAALSTWLMYSQLKGFIKTALKVNYKVWNIITLVVSILFLVGSCGWVLGGTLIMGGIALQILIEQLDAPPECSLGVISLLPFL